MKDYAVKIDRLLEELGETKKEVAKKLISLGIKGKRGNCKSCPISKYLTKKRIKNAHTSKYQVFIRREIGKPAGKYFDLPAPVYNFITAFDEGKYPHLIEGRFIRATL